MSLDRGCVIDLLAAVGDAAICGAENGMLGYPGRKYELKKQVVRVKRRLSCQHV